jgi:hypothetical protein
MEVPETFDPNEIDQNLDDQLDDYTENPDYIPSFPQFPNDIIEERDNYIDGIDNMIAECRQLRKELRVKALNEKLNLINNEPIKDDDIPKVRNKVKLKELPKTPKPMVYKPDTHVVINRTGNAEYEMMQRKLAQQDKAIDVYKHDAYIDDIEKLDAELESYMDDIDDLIKMGEEIDTFIEQCKEGK